MNCKAEMCLTTLKKMSSLQFLSNLHSAYLEEVKLVEICGEADARHDHHQQHHDQHHQPHLHALLPLGLRRLLEGATKGENYRTIVVASYSTIRRSSN